jgi:hypothetical protein
LEHLPLKRLANVRALCSFSVLTYVLLRLTFATSNLLPKLKLLCWP